MRGNVRRDHLGIALRYLESVDMIVTVWDGVVTAADWTQAIRAELANPDSALGNRRMTDARTAEVPGISEEQVEAILDEYKNVDVVVSRVRLAMVVTDGWNIAHGGRGRLTPVAPNMRRTVARSRSAREG
jgi:hypothetical protein